MYLLERCLKMRRKKRLIGVIMGVLILMLYGCSSVQDNSVNEQLLNEERSEGRPASGAWFQLSPSHNEGLVGMNDLILETPQDEIVLTIGASRNAHVPIMIKVFYNYEEVPFLIGDAAGYVTQYLVELPYGSNQIDLSLRLSSELEANESFNALTIGIFSHPEYLSKNDDHFSIRNDFAGIFNFRVSYGGEESLLLRVPYQELPQQLNLYHRGVMINQNPAAFTLEYSDGGVFTMHPNPLQVAPNEVVTFYFYANPQTTDEIESLENYLIISLLGWQQIQKNGQPYLLIEARLDDMVNDLMDHGSFTVTMPSEPGFYEFVTFIVPDPTNFNDFFMDFPLELSFPFTVEVVE